MLHLEAVALHSINAQKTQFPHQLALCCPVKLQCQVKQCMKMKVLFKWTVPLQRNEMTAYCKQQSAHLCWDNIMGIMTEH